jgi:hypothetical protein
MFGISSIERPASQALTRSSIAYSPSPLIVASTTSGFESGSRSWEGCGPPMTTLRCRSSCFHFEIAG